MSLSTLFELFIAILGVVSACYLIYVCWIYRRYAACRKASPLPSQPAYLRRAFI